MPVIVPSSTVEYGFVQSHPTYTAAFVTFVETLSHMRGRNYKPAFFALAELLPVVAHNSRKGTHPGQGPSPPGQPSAGVLAVALTNVSLPSTGAGMPKAPTMHVAR